MKALIRIELLYSPNVCFLSILTLWSFQAGTSVDTCGIHSASLHEAIWGNSRASQRKAFEEAWMDIVQEYLDQKRPMELLEKSVDVARTMDFFYKHDDAYTSPLSVKDTITSMYVNSV